MSQFQCISIHTGRITTIPICRKYLYPHFGTRLFVYTCVDVSMSQFQCISIHTGRITTIPICTKYLCVTISMYIYTHWQDNHNTSMHKIPIPTFWYTIVCIYMCRCIDVTISMFIYTHWQNNHNTYMLKIPIPTFWYSIVMCHNFNVYLYTLAG